MHKASAPGVAGEKDFSGKFVLLSRGTGAAPPPRGQSSRHRGKLEQLLREGVRGKTNLGAHFKSNPELFI